MTITSSSAQKSCPAIHINSVLSTDFILQQSQGATTREADDKQVMEEGW